MSSHHVFTPTVDPAVSDPPDGSTVALALVLLALIFGGLAAARLATGGATDETVQLGED